MAKKYIQVKDLENMITYKNRVKIIPCDSKTLNTYPSVFWNLEHFIKEYGTYYVASLTDNKDNKTTTITFYIDGGRQVYSYYKDKVKNKNE